MERAVPARARSWPVSPHVPPDDVLGLLPLAGVGALALLSASHRNSDVSDRLPHLMNSCMSETFDSLGLPSSPLAVVPALLQVHARAPWEAMPRTRTVRVRPKSRYIMLLFIACIFFCFLISLIGANMKVAARRI